MVKKCFPSYFTDIARKENVIESHISLSWGNAVIDSKKSAHALGLTIADILECYIHDTNADKENEITITVRSAKNSSTFSVCVNECVERVLNEFTNLHAPEGGEGDEKGAAASGGKTKFSFDGEFIKDLKAATFASLDMMDGDIIDAI